MEEKKQEPIDLLKPDLFRAWIVALSDDVEMRAGNPEKCPLARYLGEVFPGIQVFPSGYALYGLDRDVEMPAWAEQFICIIDETYRNQSVSPTDALAAFDEAIEWLESRSYC